ncbi:MAG: AbrB/MazE/SpoVT family DNA-binding domain-containing protein [Deltaproteobacteria bacterium]|nr:AbrB/MazE/SpoVT family DNA-binding domain-containing protein [Deltaproteobacteria bacterium]
MYKRSKGASCCGPEGKVFAGCRVESLITVDERGQTVLPKELRDRAGIKGGDKLAVISWEKEGKVCCLSLIKVEEFSGMVKGVLGPLMGELLTKE